MFEEARRYGVVTPQHGKSGLLGKCDFCAVNCDKFNVCHLWGVSQLGWPVVIYALHHHTLGSILGWYMWAEIT